MNTESFAIKHLLMASWNIFKANKRFILFATLATIAVRIILQIIQNDAGFLGSLLSIFVGILVALGWTTVLLHLVRSSHVDWNTFKTKPVLWLQFLKSYLWYFGYFILYAILSIIPGAILVLVGGIVNVSVLTIIGGALVGLGFSITAIYFGIRYQFLNFVVVDDHTNLIPSKELFKQAGKLTKGYFWKLVLVGIILGLINLLGLLCLVVGLLVTIPVTKLTQAKIYEFLKHHHHV